jgi:hypothetical protein
MQHIRQEDPRGCGIACLAMLAGSTYRRIGDHAGPQNPEWGLTCDETARHMSSRQPQEPWAVRRFSRPYRPLDRRDLSEWPRFAHGLSIREPGVPGSTHAIVVCEGSVYDPEFLGPGPLLAYARNEWDLLCIVAPEAMLHCFPRVKRASR